MKALTAKTSFTGSSAWGRTCTTDRQRFEVEQCDVGQSKHNYLGYGQPSYLFQSSDVGRVIEVITDGTGYNCFSFVTGGAA